MENSRLSFNHQRSLPLPKDTGPLIMPDATPPCMQPGSLPDERSKQGLQKQKVPVCYLVLAFYCHITEAATVDTFAGEKLNLQL
jgi:hypothetical protein